MAKLLDKIDAFFNETDIEAFELSANLIVILIGIINTFRNEYFQDILTSKRGVSMSNFMVTNMLTGVVSGLLTYYLGSALLKICSSVLGGKASWSESRVVFSWSSIPILITSFCTLLMYISLKTFGGLEPYMTVLDLFEHPIVKAAKYISIFGLLLSGLMTTYLISKVSKFSIIRAVACVLLYTCVPLFLLTPFVLVNII